MKGHAVTHQRKGKPKKYETPELLEEAIAGYLAVCKAEERPVTFTGMALHLGFSDRASLYRYEKDPAYSDVVKRARALVERAYEERLWSNRGQVAGAIFALKNYGWSDRMEVTGAGGGPIQVEETDVIRKRFADRIAGVAARLSAGGGLAADAED